MPTKPPTDAEASQWADAVMQDLTTVLRRRHAATPAVIVAMALGSLQMTVLAELVEADPSQASSIVETLKASFDLMTQAIIEAARTH